MVGNKSARILYKGRSPQFPGIDQINFEVPADAPEGCHVPLAVRVGGVVSNFASIAIASAGAVCSDAIGFSAADMEKIRSTPNLRFGDVVLTKTTVIDLKATLDDVQAVFYRYDQDTALKANRLGRQAGEAGESHLPYGACTVTSGRGDPTRAQGFPGARPSTSKARVAPNRSQWAVTAPMPLRWAGGDYGPELRLVPGLYTVYDHQAGPIGAGAFRGHAHHAGPIEWTNRDSFSVVWRSQDLTSPGAAGTPRRSTFKSASIPTTRSVRSPPKSRARNERQPADSQYRRGWLTTLPVSSGTYPGTSLPAESSTSGPIRSSSRPGSRRRGSMWATSATS